MLTCFVACSTASRSCSRVVHLLLGVRATFDPSAKFATNKEAEVKQREKVRLGLDKPVIEQYGSFLGQVRHGDWGRARAPASVWPMIQPRHGQHAAAHHPRRDHLGRLRRLPGRLLGREAVLPGDYIFTTLSFIGIALPPFWFGLMAIQFFVVQSSMVLLRRAPQRRRQPINADYARHLVLPILTLTVQIIAGWSRFQRASMLDVLSADYVRTATSQGRPAPEGDLPPRASATR